MKNNSTPDASGSGEWNSDEIALGGLSCEQIARLGTTFLGAFRIMRGNYVNEGPLAAAKQLHSFIGNQIKIVEAGIIPSVKDGGATDAIDLCMLSVGMAAIATISSIDPRQAGTLSVQLIQGMMQVYNEKKEKGEPIGYDETLICACRVPDAPAKEGHVRIDIALHVEKLAVPSSAFTKAVKAIVTESKQNPSGLHGAN